MNTCYLVIRFDHGAFTVYEGFDSLKAREVYDAEKSAQLMTSTGRDTQGNVVPGKMIENFILQRKFHGIEQEVTN
jgi:hypothetical protein